MAVQPENIPNGSDNNAINEDVALSELAKVKSTERTPSENHNLAITRRIVIYAFITILIMITTTITLIAVSLSVTAVKTNVTKYNPLTTHIVFTKNQWGGTPALNFTKPLHHPIEYVIISHTAGKFCTNFTECAPIVQTIQSEHVSKLKSPDIGYNFLIGGDGNVYTGRGWDIRNFHTDNSIGISYIGNFVFDSLTTRMIDALKELLDLGVKLNKLSPDYKLVCHNQTYATLSPGDNVFKEMVKLHNYQPGRVEFK